MRTYIEEDCDFSTLMWVREDLRPKITPEWCLWKERMVTTNVGLVCFSFNHAHGVTAIVLSKEVVGRFDPWKNQEI